MGQNLESNNYGLNVNMVGESLYLLSIYLTRNIYTKTKSIDIKEKKSIFDYWDFNYEFNLPIDKQIENVFKIYERNKSDCEINSKEVLIVHIKDKNSEFINIIFSRMEQLKLPHYMPLVLFLIDEYNDKDNKIIPNKELYPNINPSTIYSASFIDDKEYIFQSMQKELTEVGENKMDKIINILLRFCSYHNDLGDRFSIGEGDKKINYDLTEKYFPFTINICCVGRFGKGKSTCVNCLLGETKAKESKSGASTTKKINYYQINDQPIKIYDIPGFENKETIMNAVIKLKELNDEINELKDQIHVIIYILKSTDERMFADIEYDIINEISNQKKSKLLYILTHSSKNTNKEEKIDMINVGIKNILEKNKIDNLNYIFSKIKANNDNCIFVNFHEDEDKPIYGIGELFYKISSIAKETDIYKKYIRQNMSDFEFQKFIKEEADIRKAKAEKILLYHSIGAGAIGIIPIVDIAVQKFVIQKNAIKKIGQIFGLDINLISKEEDSFNIKNANNENNFEIIDNNNNNNNNNNENTRNAREEYNNNENSGNSNEKYSRAGQYSSSGMGIGSASLLCKGIKYISKFAQVSKKVVGQALKNISITFIFLGSAIGIGTGYYFTYKHCNELIQKLYQYFLENIRYLSDSFIQGVQYLEMKAKNYFIK